LENQQQLQRPLGHTLPYQPEHRAEQLDYIEEVARNSPGVWLNSIHFAEHGHMHMSTLQRTFGRKAA
jgi:hypothetical protein